MKMQLGYWWEEVIFWGVLSFEVGTSEVLLFTLDVIKQLRMLANAVVKATVRFFLFI